MPINLTEEQLEKLHRIAVTIAEFEEAPSVKGQTAGQARGGRMFESRVEAGILDFVDLATQLPYFTKATVKTSNKRRAVKNAIALQIKDASQSKDKAVVFCFGSALSKSIQNSQHSIVVDDECLRKSYKVSDWCDSKLPDVTSKGWIPTAQDKYATQYYDTNYKQIYSEFSTAFDGTILLMKDSELYKKYLIECKSAKSSDKNKIDGNAHERFAYQTLEYLEICHLNPKTAFILMANEAFVKYRNKYHIGFCVHTLRLSSKFPNFSLDIICTRSQYYCFFKSILDWMVEE
ncbi:MAG: hypothetical protein SNJ72_04345 [Fimbriimonadales bacterium]